MAAGKKIDGWNDLRVEEVLTPFLPLLHGRYRTTGERKDQK